MARQRKPYNPNTAFGRKKIREEFEVRRLEMTPAERSSNDFWSTVMVLVLIVMIAGCAYCAGGSKGMLKALSH
jgi:hypothetical protein